MTAPTLTRPTVVEIIPAPALPTTAAQTPRLGRRALRHEHRVTLESPRRCYSLIAQMLFRPMDLIYGRPGMLGRRHRDAGLAHRIQERIVENRDQQDNEQWHLLIMSELVAARGGGRSRFRFRVLPWLMALTYYHVSWLLFVVAPAWSYRRGADLEDHAEHTYAEYVAAHPELETVPHGSQFARRYGAHESMADLLRQIGHDERMHKQESERYLADGPLR